jgi:hypothetical protein
MREYQKNWKEHVEIMQDGRLPKLDLKYQPVENDVEVVSKRYERPVLGRQSRNSGLINLVNSSGRRS